MERLALCSKVLYDRDILEKQKRILELEKPRVKFKNPREWTRFKNDMYDELRSVIKECIEDDAFERHHMIWQGLTSRQEMRIALCIEKRLTELTKNVKWAQEIAWDTVVYSVNAMFQSFIKTNLWETLYHSLSPEEMSDIIYSHIVWQLDDDTHAPCILDDIATYDCLLCSKIDDYVSDDGYCYDCEDFQITNDKSRKSQTLKPPK
jgi:hypothetical protein